MNRMEQYFDYCKLIPNDKFFCSYMDIPCKKDDWYVDYYMEQIKKNLMEPLEKTYGVDFSDEKLLAAIEEHNEVCRIITEIGDMRKLDNPPITGYEFHVIQLVTLVCPKYLILPYLRETLEELRTREPEPAPWYRARVMIAGSEIDDPEFTKLLESCGAFAVADRYCFGSMPGREEIIVKDGESPLKAIAEKYLKDSQCPRSMGRDNVNARKRYIYDKAKEFRADGIILENMKFCEYWGYERAHDAAVISSGENLPSAIPVCQIEKEYCNGATGQLRTRFQAFVESLEIKHIQANN